MRTKALAIGFFAYSEVGTEYDWTDRTLEAGLTSITETTEEELLEFSHGDVTVTLDDRDGVVSGLLMGLSPKARWRGELWRDPSNWTLLWGGIIDPTEIERDYEKLTVRVRVLAYSKRCDFASAEAVKRSVTGVTGTVTAGSSVVTVSSATNLEIDDDIQLASGGVVEAHKITGKSGLTLTTLDLWSNNFTTAPLTLLTPYWRGKTPDFLATELFKVAGFAVPNVRAPQLTLDDPIPLRMNSTGLTRVTVECVSRRGTNIAAFEAGASYRAASPVAGFSVSADAVKWPSDWTAYGGAEPATFKDIADQDRGFRVAGRQAVYYWYGAVESTVGPTSTNWKLLLKRSDGASVIVNQQNYTNDLGWQAAYDFWVEYNVADASIWISWQRWEIRDAETRSVVAVGCNAYTEALAGGGTRTTAQNKRLRYLSSGKMVIYDDVQLQIISAISAYGIEKTLEHRPNLLLWTMRRVWYDTKYYLMCIQYASQYYRLVVWDEASGLVIYEQLITQALGPLQAGAPRAYGSVWYDTTGADDVYVGYVQTIEGGGYYFYVSKSGTGTIEYADFSGQSVSSALHDVAVSSGALIWVDHTQGAYFTPRSQIAAAFGSTATAVTDYFDKRKRNVWEWYRSSCSVSGKDQASGTEFTETYGDTGNMSYRLDVDASLVGSPALAYALAKEYVGYLNKTDGSWEITVPEPTVPLHLFNKVSFDGFSYRIYSVRSNFAARQQALVVVKE